MHKKRPSLASLFVLLILLIPFLSRCQTIQRTMPEPIYRLVGQSLPTATPKPIVHVDHVERGTPNAAAAPTQTTAAPKATSTVVSLYNPPPSASPNRTKHIGKGGSPDRGNRYATDLTLRVGSFSTARESWHSFWSGGASRGARRMLQAEYPEIEPILFDELTSENLAEVDVFFLTSDLESLGNNGQSELYLTESERAALRSFVEAGGWLMAGMSPIDKMMMDVVLKTEPARQIASIFDLEVLPERPPSPAIYPPLVAADTHRLMNEPWGKIDALFASQPVSFGDLGPHAETIALNDDEKPMIVAINPGRLAPDSGMALFAPKSMVTSFQHKAQGTWMNNSELSIADNDLFFFNFIDLALQAKAYRHGDTSIPDPALPYPASTGEVSR